MLKLSFINCILAFILILIDIRKIKKINSKENWNTFLNLFIYIFSLCKKMKVKFAKVKLNKKKQYRWLVNLQNLNLKKMLILKIL